MHCETLNSTQKLPANWHVGRFDPNNQQFNQLAILNASFVVQSDPIK
jgi:hypothetical protein